MRLKTKDLKVLLILIYLVFTFLGEVDIYRDIAPFTMGMVLFLLFFVYFLEKKTRIRFKPNIYEIWMLLFTFLCLMSTQWALYENDALSMAKNIFEMVVATIIISVCTKETFTLNDYLNIIMACGYILTTMLFLYYGIFNMCNLFVGNVRLGNDFMNVNTVGMMAAYSVLINVYYIKIGLVKWWTIFLIPAFIVILLGESKKVLIILFIGAIFLYYVRKNGKGRKIKLYKVIIVICAFFVIFFLIVRLFLYNSLYLRLTKFLNELFKPGTGDWSTQLRVHMIQIGMSYFVQHPWLGIGIDNIGRIIAKSLKYSTKISVYSHNNYVELLSNLGIVGGLLYYSIYFYIFIKLSINLRIGNNDIIIALIFILCRLIIDFASVSYSVKFTYFTGMIVYLVVLKFDVRKIKMIESRKSLG